MLQNWRNNIVYAVLWLVSWWPLRMLYWFSDFAYVLVYHVVGYRRKVVRQNLENAFPQKTHAERQRIERGFYRYLCDCMVEALRMMHMTPDEISRHITFEELDVLQQCAASGRNVYAVFGHYGNWEWVASLPLHLQGWNVATLYRPLHNAAMDNAMRRLRARFGTYCYSDKQVLRGIVQLRNLGKPFVLAFIADQTPRRRNTHYWTQWLNQETPFFDGWEQLARKHNEPVIFMQMKRVKRGEYNCRFILLSENPAETAPHELVERYARLMEQTILEQPECWLWSHRRWKFKKTV